MNHYSNSCMIINNINHCLKNVLLKTLQNNTQYHVLIVSAFNILLDNTDIRVMLLISYHKFTKC